MVVVCWTVVAVCGAVVVVVVSGTVVEVEAVVGGVRVRHPIDAGTSTGSPPERHVLL